MNISAVVLAKDEEKNIKECLESLAWCDEIIVIDDFSEDKTVEIVQKVGAKVFQHPLNNDFATQHNFGLKKARGEWVLFVDSDERVSSALKNEILKYTSVFQYSGFYLKRQDYYGGRILKHGETAKIRLLRLGKKGSGQWQRKVHEIWVIKGDIGELNNPLLHYPHPTIGKFMCNINYYSTLHAQVLHDENIKPSIFRIIFYPMGKFVQNYFFRLGFLDGTPGFIVAMMMSFHSFLAQGKLFLLSRQP